MDGNFVGFVLLVCNHETFRPNQEKYSNNSPFLQAIDSVKYPSEGTLLGKGLHGVKEDLYSHSRPGVPRILVVLTDGKSKDDVTGPARALHDMDVRVMVVGIGPYLDVKQLNAVASGPKPEHVFTAGSFGALGKVIEKVEKEICKGISIY